MCWEIKYWRKMEQKRLSKIKWLNWLEGAALDATSKRSNKPDMIPSTIQREHSLSGARKALWLVNYCSTPTVYPLGYEGGLERMIAIQGKCVYIFEIKQYVLRSVPPNKPNLNFPRPHYIQLIFIFEVLRKI